MSELHEVALERRHWSWLNLPPVVQFLTVRSENGWTYVQLLKPSRELAAQALIEAVLKHAETFGSYPSGAPRLIIEVTE